MKQRKLQANVSEVKMIALKMWAVLEKQGSQGS